MLADVWADSNIQTAVPGAMLGATHVIPQLASHLVWALRYGALEKCSTGEVFFFVSFSFMQLAHMKCLVVVRSKTEGLVLARIGAHDKFVSIAPGAIETWVSSAPGARESLFQSPQGAHETRLQSYQVHKVLFQLHRVRVKLVYFFELSANEMLFQSHRVHTKVVFSIAPGAYERLFQSHPGAYERLFQSHRVRTKTVLVVPGANERMFQTHRCTRMMVSLVPGEGFQKHAFWLWSCT